MVVGTASSSTPAKDTSAVPEWDNAATVALTVDANVVKGQTFALLGSQHGLPTTACLNALYNAIKYPKGGDLTKSIYFNAFAATYDNATGKLAGKVTIADNKPYSSKGKASQCAERGLWKDVGSSLSGKTLMGIGQDTCPCMMCCARFSALAVSKGVTIMVLYEEEYDQMPGYTWLLFPPTVGTAVYTS